MHTSGFHQLVVRDSNAYLPGTLPIWQRPRSPARGPNPSLGIMDQYFPEAVINENQVIVNVNARFSPKFSVMGFYAGSWANSDGGGGSSPSNSYNLRQDYGRASFIRPQWVFLMGNYTRPVGNHLQSIPDCPGREPVQRDIAVRSHGRQLL